MIPYKIMFTILLAMAILIPLNSAFTQEDAKIKALLEVINDNMEIDKSKFYKYEEEVREQFLRSLGIIRNRTKIDVKELKNRLEDHKKWLESKGKLGKRADLIGVELAGVDLKRVDLGGGDFQIPVKGVYKMSKQKLVDGAKLQGADLEKANLEGTRLYLANLQRARLIDANLQEAHLRGANLRDAHLANANLRRADMAGSDLGGADLRGANLQGVDLSNANLKGANLTDANLKEADLWNANLEGAVFELVSNGLPNTISIGRAKSLESLRYDEFPQTLVEIRAQLKEAGLRKQEREVTYAIRHTETLKSLGRSPQSYRSYERNNLADRIEGYFNYFLFDLTCEWGMSPGRPFLILIILFCPFSVIYMLSLTQKNKKDGIWKHWIKERSRTDLGRNDAELLTYDLKIGILCGFYFSLLSAFHIGWRDLNVGSWITRMQPHEYTLRASGWVRVVSGIQSLISVYLLALAVLTYFGRPFESY